MSEKILITGASGFLGSEINSYLNIQKFEILTLGRAPSNDIVCDLSKEIIKLENIDVVIHVAGKAHLIPKTDSEIKNFYEVNVTGTENLLKSLSINLPSTFIFMSTVAVYGIDTGIDIKESSPLNGISSYAKSKIIAEEKVLSFCNSSNVNVIILRLPLVTGESPKGNLGSMIQAIKKGYYFRVGNGNVRRSMVSALDIAKLIPTLYNKNGIYNLTDRRHPSFKEIDTFIANYYGKSIKEMPVWALVALAKIGDVIKFFPLNSLKLEKMTKSLTFSDEKAVRELGWCPDNALKYIRE